jgi:Ca2+-binding EF-hand superfamily protein
MEMMLSEYHRILTENGIKFRKYTIEELFKIIDDNGFVYFHHFKDGIEYTVTIQDTSGEIIVITEQ